MINYHWTPAAQRLFVETLAETGSVMDAADAAKMTRNSAYRLRHRADGKLFRIGWDAAVRISRVVIADTMLAWAMDGEWTETVRDKESGSTRRHARNHKFGLAMLARLDKMAEASADRNSVDMAAQIAEQDFDAFLDVLEGADGAAAQDFFVSRRHWWHCGRVAPQDVLFGAEWDADGEEWFDAVEVEPFACHLPQNSGEEEGENVGKDDEMEAGDAARDGPTPSRHPELGSGSTSKPDSAVEGEAETWMLNQVQHDGVDCHLRIKGTVPFNAENDVNHRHLPLAEVTANPCNLPQNSVFLRGAGVPALRPVACSKASS